MCGMQAVRLCQPNDSLVARVRWRHAGSARAARLPLLCSPWRHPAAQPRGFIAIARMPFTYSQTRASSDATLVRAPVQLGAAAAAEWRSVVSYGQAWPLHDWACRCILLAVLFGKPDGAQMSISAAWWEWRAHKMRRYHAGGGRGRQAGGPSSGPGTLRLPGRIGGHQRCMCRRKYVDRRHSESWPATC